MKILITGATGFIGSNLAKKLTEEGHEVTALVRKKSNVDFLKEIGVKIIYCDLADCKNLKKELNQIDIIYHLAGLKGGLFYPEERYYEVHVKFTENILDNSPKNLYRFIYCSSVAVYGNNFKKNELPVNESHPYKSYNLFSRTKLAAEKTVKRLAPIRNIPYTIIKPGLTYGPRDISSITLFRLIKKFSFFIFSGKGDNLIHPTYIDDLVAALLLTINSKKAVNEEFLITGKEITTTNQFISIISKILDTNIKIKKIYFSKFLMELISTTMDTLRKNFPIDFPITKMVDFLVKNKVYDWSKAEKELGYKPKVGLKEGVKKTIEWYKAMKLI